MTEKDVQVIFGKNLTVKHRMLILLKLLKNLFISTNSLPQHSCCDL